MSVFIAIIILM